MEIDSRNIKRLIKIFNHRICQKKTVYVMRILSWLYLIGSYIYMLEYFKAGINESSRPLGWFFVVCVTILMYLVYVLLNHVIIKKFVKHKLLFTIELLLMISLLVVGV